MYSNRGGVLTFLLAIFFTSCKNDSDDEISVSNITLEKTTLELKAGETSIVQATIFPEDATDKGVLWKSSDTKIATVTPKAGNALTATVKVADDATTGTKVTITARAKSDETKTATCQITVKSSDQDTGSGDKDPPMHTHTLETRIIKEASCTESGIRETYCTVCEEVSERETIAPAHNWASIILTQTGEMQGVCSACNFTMNGAWEKETLFALSDALKNYAEVEAKVKVSEAISNDDIAKIKKALTETPSKSVTLDLSETREVSEIGAFAFSGCTGLSSVTIPESIKTIGEHAFEGCTSLETINYTGTSGQWNEIQKGDSAIPDGVTVNCAGGNESNIFWLTAEEPEKISGEYVIPDGFTKIGSLAFKGCTGLTSIIIPDSVTEICSYAFQGCTGLTSIIIPNSVIEIGRNAFADCTGLTSIKLPDSIKEIGYAVFASCERLSSVKIPNSVTKILNSAFECCTNLATVEIPVSVTFIDAYAFYYIKNLVINYAGTFSQWEAIEKSYSFDSENVTVKYKGLFTLTEEEKKNISGKYVIPNDTTEIGANAFKDCANLTSIEIPDSVTKIDWGAFEGCTGLTSIEIPNSVTEIDWGAFTGCTSLASITIPDSVTEIGNSTFEGCTGLTNIEIPNSVTKIGANAFEGCTGLTNIEIPNSVTKIGANAFEGCTTLVIHYTGTRSQWNAIEVGGYHDYTIPWTTIIYCKDTFTLSEDEKKNISGEYVIPDGFIEIGRNAFEDCTGLTSIKIPNSVTKISRASFYGCTSLASVELPDSITKIEAHAFGHCEKLNSVTIPSSVTEIGDYAFFNCGFSTLEIPNGVISIGTAAFQLCDKLESVKIPVSVTEIGVNAFDLSNKLFVDYAGTFEQLSEIAYVGNAFSSNSVIRYKGLLILNDDEKKNISSEYVIPNDITEIGKSTFEGCTGLTSITIPNSVTKIGTRAFESCTNLKNVTFEKESQLAIINYNAFQNCTNLERIMIPNGVTEICSDAFSGCTSLTSITIPNGVTEIDFNTFYGCKNLERITIPDSVTRIRSNAFSGCTSLTSVTFADPTDWKYRTSNSLGDDTGADANVSNAATNAKNLTDANDKTANWTYGMFK